MSKINFCTVRVPGWRAVTMVCFCLVGCGGSSVEGDARQLGAIICKAQTLAKRAVSGDMSVMKDSQQLAAEAAALQRKLESKYTSPSDAARFTAALEKEIAKCK